MALHNYTSANRVFPHAVLDGEGRDISDREMDALVQNDPVAKQLFAELGWKKIDQTYNENAVKKGSTNAYADQYRDQVERLQKQLDERLSVLRPESDC